MSKSIYYWNKTPFRYINPKTGEGINKPKELEFTQATSANSEMWEHSLVRLLSMIYNDFQDTGGDIYIPISIIDVLKTANAFTSLGSYELQDNKVGVIYNSINVYLRGDELQVIDIKTSQGFEAEIQIKN
jgi:hypothetical protein